MVTSGVEQRPIGYLITVHLNSSSLNSSFLLYLQALASERELVLALLDPDSIVDSPTTNQMSKSQESNSQKIESDITFVLDRIFEGVCRPFKLRVEQVLQSQSSLIISYKLSNTLEFYSYTVSVLFCDSME